MFTFRTLPARLMFADDPAPEGGGGGPKPEPKPGPPAPEPKPAADPDDDDLASKIEGHKKVNRDLERKLDEARKRGDRVDELEAEIARLQGKEAEHAELQKQREVEAAALAKANERILKAEIRAAAAGKLADPADALRFLDLSDFEVGADGEVDTAAVTEAIDDLAKSKPYLAAQGGKPGPVFESPGAHRKEAPPSQLSRDDLKQMTPEQINAARAEGRLNDLLGVKS